MSATQPASLRFAALLAAAMLLCVAGCATTSGGAPLSVDRAERMLRRGDDVGAAQMYEQLAQSNPPPARNDLALAAARAWLAANRADDAQRALNLAATGPTAAQRNELGMLRAQVAMARGQYAAAWQQVSELTQPTDAAAAARLLQLRQQVALRSGRPIDAVRAGLERENLATSDQERTAARRDLLTGLRSAIDGGLRVDPGASNDPLVRGWLELGLIAASAGRSPLSAQSAVAGWRARFPGHPGSTVIDSEILHPGERPGQVGPGLPISTGPVALLLPLSSPQANVASAAGLVRAGFEAAMATLPEADRPTLRVYDTSALQVGTALLNAQADGAGFIVGPLQRDAVQDALQQRPGNLPLLLLNTLPGNGFVGSQIYQFALSPEDEARQIARQIAGHGRANTVVFAPIDDWGSRVANAFAEELTRDGGSVIERRDYGSSRDESLISGSLVTGPLGIDSAIDRKNDVQAAIGTRVGFNAYPRPDIDAIFVAGWESEALRLINTQLRFHNADDLPIYITQDGLSGKSANNRDLLDMWVLDTPWDLDSVGPVADLRTATQPQWSAQGPRQSRFFAFGYDAATITMALRRGGAAWPLAGLTGSLQLNPEGRIETSLNWARVTRDGQIQPADPVAN